MFKYGIDTLTSGKALQIARGKLSAGLSSEAREKIEKCHQEVLAIANGDRIVYGVNTGFGPLCNSKIDKENTTLLQKNLLRSHSVGVGKPIDTEIAKLMLILKVHALAQGFSGISNEVLDRILWHIENDAIPMVPEQGSVGASGDLAPLSHLFLPLLGDGEVMHKGQVKETKEVLDHFNLAPLDLHPKAGLALINGTQFIAAHAILVVEKLHRCLAHSDIIGALMVEGLHGSNAPYHDDLHKIRPFKGNIHVAKRMLAFTQDSEIMESHKDCDRVQDPYSMRCIPQVHGSSRDAWLHLKEKVEIEINSVTDNPIVFSRDFTVSGGNFHGQPLALVVDYACLAAAELGNISDRRSYLSLEGKYDCVPKLLLKNTGLNSGFMILQYTGAAVVSENKGLCFPSSADSIPTSLGQEDHVSMGSIGSRKALQVCENVEKVLAVELLCAAQAFDFSKPLKSSDILDEIHAYIRTKVTHATEDRIFGNDIKKAIEILQGDALLDIVKNKIQGFSEYDSLFEEY